VLTFAVVALLVSAQGSATPTATLNGEQFYAPGFRTAPQAVGSTSGCVVNPDGSTSLDFVEQGLGGTTFQAHGPYPGGWTVHGHLTVSGDDINFRRIVSLAGSFTIDSGANHVSGTFGVDPAASTDPPNGAMWAAGFTGCSASGGSGGIFDARSLVWQATIADGSGSLADQGTATFSANLFAAGNDAQLNFILTSVPVSTDSDGDGIDDDVDVPGADPAFSDAVPPALGSGTSGLVGSVDPGASVVVEDAEDASQGVKITVLGTGFAQLSVCGTYSVAVHAQATFYVTCHSVGLSVLQGEVTVNLSNDTSVTVPAGSSATVAQGTGGRYSITDVSGPITLTIEGQTKVVTAPVTIAAWTFVGFAQPVDNGGVLNVLQAGQAVPLKWRLLDPTGAPVTDLAAASLAVTTVACTAGTSTDDVEQVVASGSALQNLGDGYYQLNWKSSKTYAGSCRKVDLDLGEGITRPALFKFKS
jgi:hypothetical protein